MTDPMTPRFRPDAAIATVHLQKTVHHKVHERTSYHCPEHGPRTGDAVGFGGHELKQTNCKVSVTETKLCWLPLEKRVENREWDALEFTAPLQDFDDYRYEDHYDYYGDDD